MRLFIAAFITTLTLFGASNANAADFFRRVEFPVSGVFIPEGFDNNDSVQFMAHGQFPNSCFQAGYVTTEFDSDTNKLYVSLIAYEYVGKCSDYGSPFHLTVHAGLIRKAASYGVYDKKTGLYLGALNIAQAKPKEAGTDENNYAPVLDGFIMDQEGGKALVLRGTTPWSCLKVEDIKVIVQQNVVVVLPNMVRKDDEKCVVGDFAYEVTHKIKEQLPKGEFLLHIRSMGGQSINKIVMP